MPADWVICVSPTAKGDAVGKVILVGQLIPSVFLDVVDYIPSPCELDPF